MIFLYNTGLLEIAEWDPGHLQAVIARDRNSVFKRN